MDCLSSSNHIKFSKKIAPASHTYSYCWWPAIIWKHFFRYQLTTEDFWQSRLCNRWKLGFIPWQNLILIWNKTKLLHFNSLHNVAYLSEPVYLRKWLRICLWSSFCSHLWYSKYIPASQCFIACCCFHWATIRTLKQFTRPRSIKLKSEATRILFRNYILIAK